MMKSAQNEIIILNNRAIHSKGVKMNLEKNGSINKSLTYVYTTPTPYRPVSRIGRAYYKVIGSISEFFTLLGIRLKGNLRILFYYPTGSFLELIYYHLLSKFFFTRLICHYVEYRSSFDSRAGFFTRTNDRLFDKYFMHFIDGSIPISRFLMKHILDNKNIPCIKIPPVVDFDEIDKIKKIDEGNFFMYVGSAAFIDAIQTTISAFEQTDDKGFNLYLILSGSGLDKFKEKVGNSSKKHLIKIMSGLPYDQLIGLMKGAAALLIPLNERIQDQARFPNKIAEYLASRRPIITNSVGDIEEYFRHGHNAVLAEDSTVNSYARSLQFVIDNPQKSDEIGKNGYKTGREYFSTQSISGPLQKFLDQFLPNQAKP